jgi:two-component system KDP operon response regulator KdpE
MTNTHQPLALVIDDEVQIRRLLRLTLEAATYRVIDASTGQAGLTEAATRRPDIVILDLGLPDLDGTEVLRRLREWSAVPVIVLSVREGEEDKIRALDQGADDYVTKPFAAGELLARMRVAIRNRLRDTEPSVLRFGAVEIDLAARIVRRSGDEVKLTATEYELFRALARHSGRVVTHRQLLREVWGAAYEEQTHYLRVYVGHLREKLEDDPSRPRLFLTEPGVGYRLLAPEDAPRRSS